MAYVPVPKDLTKVKSKFLFNLTKRQVVCFGAGALVGVPVFFLTRGTIGASAATFLMILIMLPFFMFAMYEKHGQPLEVLIRQIYHAKFVRPKHRIYQTDNFYAAIDRGVKLQRKANRIVQGKNQKATQEKRRKAEVDSC